MKRRCLSVALLLPFLSFLCDLSCSIWRGKAFLLCCCCFSCLKTLPSIAAFHHGDHTVWTTQVDVRPAAIALAFAVPVKDEGGLRGARASNSAAVRAKTQKVVHHTSTAPRREPCRQCKNPNLKERHSCGNFRQGCHSMSENVWAAMLAKLEAFKSVYGHSR